MNASCSREYLLSNAKEREIYIERLGDLAKRTFALDRGRLFTNITPIKSFFCRKAMAHYHIPPPSCLSFLFFSCVWCGGGGEGGV